LAKEIKEGRGKKPRTSNKKKNPYSSRERKGSAAGKYIHGGKEKKRHLAAARRKPLFFPISPNVAESSTWKEGGFPLWPQKRGPYSSCKKWYPPINLGGGEKERSSSLS